ncbi:hypothetical protein TAMC210_02360 [Thermanaeromonas sp. C210]|nr:hypothetical protein TAMC210_02360 [Thermanaeromonas sp. C210]
MKNTSPRPEPELQVLEVARKLMYFEEDFLPSCRIYLPVRWPNHQIIKTTGKDKRCAANRREDRSIGSALKAPKNSRRAYSGAKSISYF